MIQPLNKVPKVKVFGTAGTIERIEVDERTLVVQGKLGVVVEPFDDGGGVFLG